MPSLALAPGFDPLSTFAVLTVFSGLVLLAAGRALTLEEEESVFAASSSTSCSAWRRAASSTCSGSTGSIRSRTPR